LSTEAHKIKKNHDNPSMNDFSEIRGEAETECIGEPSDPDYCHNYKNGVNYAYGKGNAKAVIVSKINKLYL
jgi:hypothetical protein